MGHVVAPPDKGHTQFLRKVLNLHTKQTASAESLHIFPCGIQCINFCMYVVHCTWKISDGMPLFTEALNLYGSLLLCCRVFKESLTAVSQFPSAAFIHPIPPFLPSTASNVPLFHCLHSFVVPSNVIFAIIHCCRLFRQVYYTY